MLSPLQVQNRWFGEIRLEPCDGLSEAERNERSITCRHSITARHWENDSSTWMVKLRVELVHPDAGPKSLYLGSVEAFGEFEIHPECPDEDRLKYACASGGAVLYASIKELICSITARSLHGMIELPTLDARCFLPKKNATVSSHIEGSAEQK
ncbi:MAG: hypothetical protein ACOCUY_03635 [Verrucomicrobiota bacterium]